MPRLATRPQAKKRGSATVESVWRRPIDDHVQALAWSPSGDVLAAAAIGGPIWLYDAASGETLHEMTGHGFGTTAIAWSPDGSLLASCGQDGKVRLWDSGTGECRVAMDGGSSWVERVAWCATRPILASAAGKRLRLWSPDGELLREFVDHPSTIADIAWKPGADHITAAAYGGLTIWSPDANEPVVRHEWQGSTLVIAWSPDATYIATGDQDSTVHFWIARTGDDLQMWGYPMKVRELAWNFTSRYLATGGGATVIVWDCSGRGPEGTKPLSLNGHDMPITELAFQHAGGVLASAGLDGAVVLWRPARGRSKLAAWHYDDGVSHIAWSPDDRFLAVGTDVGDVDLVRIDPGNE